MSDIIRQGRRLAKLIRADGLIEAYYSAFHYDLMVWQVSGRDGLARLLRCPMPRPDCTVVQGVVIDPSRAVDVGSLTYRDVGSDGFGYEPKGGRQETDLAGKKLYSPLIQFETTEALERWRRSVLGVLVAAGISPSAEDAA